MLSAFATTPESLIAWRALMGIGGAVIMPSARDSVGAAAGIAGRIGGEAGQRLTAVADAAFVHAMDVTVLVGAGVALAGALVALVFLPARAPQPAPETETTATGPSEATVHVG